MDISKPECFRSASRAIRLQRLRKNCQLSPTWRSIALLYDGLHIFRGVWRQRKMAQKRHEFWPPL